MPSDIYWVAPGELAGRPGPEKFPWTPEELSAEGIGAVVSLCGPVNTRQLVAAGIDHLPVYQPMILLESEIAREGFVGIMPLIEEFVERSLTKKKSVLVHCYHGCDRTGTVLACLLIARYRLDAARAVEAVRSVNPLAMNASGYAEAVATYARLRETLLRQAAPGLPRGERR